MSVPATRCRSGRRWSRARPPTISGTINYQWEESTSSSFAGTVTDIGTNSTTYTTQATDAGDYIRVVASTSDPGAPQDSATVHERDHRSGDGAAGHRGAGGAKPSHKVT